LAGSSISSSADTSLSSITGTSSQPAMRMPFRMSRVAGSPAIGRGFANGDLGTKVREVDLAQPLSPGTTIPSAPVPAHSRARPTVSPTDGGHHRSRHPGRTRRSGPAHAVGDLRGCPRPATAPRAGGR
jgi:hypothetical protein